MYQQQPEQNLSNGMAPQFESRKQNVPQDKLQQLINGVHSAHSSRSSSPSLRLGQIPSSQLPPSRSIPLSQLPPSRSPVTTITHKITGLDINRGASLNSKFSTSTPNIQSPAGFRQNGAFSPIPVPKQNTPLPSAELENVSLANASSSSENVRTPINTIVSSSQPSLQMPRLITASTSNQVSSTPQFQATNPVQQQVHSNQFISNPNFYNQPYQNPPQQKPLGSFPPQGPVNQNQALSTAMSNPSNQQKPPSRPSQVSPYTVNQSGQNISHIGPYTQANPPITSNIPSEMQNLNMNVSQYLESTTNNRSRPPNVPPANLNQPQMSQNAAPLMPQKPNLHSNRYPVPANTNMPQQQTFQQPQQPYPSRIPFQQQQPSNAYIQPQNACLNQPSNSYSPQQTFQSQHQGVVQAGFNKFWGMENYDLLQIPNILPQMKEKTPRIILGQEILDQANCSPDIFRCTMTKIPENNSLLQKSRLPLGVLIHPFRDLSHLPVIQCNVIVRCRACRTYINPFVFFVDSKRWKCNLCYRINELPEEFQYDPVTKTYGDPSRRPEIKSSTIEYIAPAEYMLRPPQPAVYLYLLDVSRLAIESGYLHSVCNILLEELKNLPGDARTQIGFLAYDSALHFYSFAEGLSRPHEMTILDIEDVFLPTPDNLLVNLKDKMELVAELLVQLPTRYNNTFDNNSALGAALQVAYRMMMATGGRVTVFQASLPNIGPGALTAREDPSQRASVEVSHLNPANDFYKRLALECSGQQIAVDLFIVNSTYVDIATISGISRFSGGCIHHFPLFKVTKTLDCESFERCFRRYLLRKIGFEAVMRIRCTRGLSIHTFHGNFFVRSTDLLSLPNINPDAGFGMQVAIEESLSDVQSVCFQAALLYTSSKGERRIRVHTMCLPVASSLQDIIHSADQQCIVGLLSKMAVDRSMQSSLSDAREAFINVAIDILTSYKMSQNLGTATSGLIAPNCLKLLPLYISALLKYPAFRTGTTTRVDDRIKAMIDMKTKPLYILIQMIYPDLYPIHDLENQQLILNMEEEQVLMPPRLHLSARCLDSKGAFLMDMGEHMIIMVLPNVSLEFLNEALGVSSYDAISDQMFEIPILDNLRNQRLHQFVNYLNEDKPFAATIQVIRDNSPSRVFFLERLIEDRVENALSYHEFLQHLKTQVK